MGVVSGKMDLYDITSGYDFFRSYFMTNGIKITIDYPDDKLIATSDLPTLKIIINNGVEIKGQGTSIEGIDGTGFEVTIFGISYPFYEEEFPHHVKAYENQFNESSGN